MSDDPHPWASDLRQLYSQVWLRLVRGVADRHAPARHPTLATVTPEGLPHARTVVLRHADAGSGTLHVHTDLHSAKVAELLATLFAALHVWDRSAHLQIRVEADVTIASGEDVADIWARVPQSSRAAYGGTPSPGSPIVDSLDYTPGADPDRFAVLRFRVVALDVLHLVTNHRRARFERSSEWKGEWLAP